MNKKLLNFIVGTLLATTTISVIMLGKGYAERKSKKIGNWFGRIILRVIH